MKKLFRNFALIMVVMCLAVTFAGCKKSSSSGNTETEIQKTVPTVTPIVAEGDYYEAFKLSVVQISLSEGDTAGTITWVNPDELLIAGENEYSYKFVPENAELYREKTGKAKVVAKTQTLTKIEIKTAPEAKTYKAFDKFDTSGLVLTLTYDKGKTEDVSSGFTVKYISGNSLLAGDTKVTICYGEKEVDLAISKVEKIELAKPTITGSYTYSGAPQTATLSSLVDAEKFTVSGNTQTNAGSYKVTVTLKDFSNYKWMSESEASYTLNFVIEKAELEVQKHNYVGTYDKLEHSAYAASDNASAIYYSLLELGETNYINASTNQIGFTNATEETKVYYYAIGDSNHKNQASYVTVKINKADANLFAGYAYTIEVSGKKANLPASYVSATGVADEVIDISGKLSFVYYTDFATGTKTTLDSGAETEGSAPEKQGTYTIEVIFAGNENYKESSCISTMVIDAPSLSFMAGENEDEFAFYDADTETYFEFMIDASEELAKVVFKNKLNSVKTTGSVWMKDNVYTATINENTTFVLTVSDKEELVLSRDGESDIVLPKFMIPKYVGVFECDAVLDGEHVNTLSIYNDYGQISFVLDAYYIEEGTEALKNKQYAGSYIGTFTEEKDGKKMTTLYFYSQKEKPSTRYFTITYEETETLDSLTIKQTTPIDIHGTYNRV